MTAQLEFGKFAGKIGAAIEQPGDGMHHPRGCAQRFARQRYPGKVFLVRPPIEASRQGKCRAHLVGQHQGLAIKPVDYAGIDGCSLRHCRWR